MFTTHKEYSPLKRGKKFSISKTESGEAAATTMSAIVVATKHFAAAKGKLLPNAVKAHMFFIYSISPRSESSSTMMISLSSSLGVLLATEAAVRSRVETGSLWKTTTTDMRGRRRGYDRERHLHVEK